jgi:hypothetical protein
MNTPSSPATPSKCVMHHFDCHQCGRCRRLLAKLHGDLDALTALLNRKLLESYAGHPGYAPKRIVTIVA